MLSKAFSQQVEKTPAKIAIKENALTLTFKELADLTGRVAALIAGAGLDPGGGNRAALLFGHGSDMVVAILGCLEAGWVYVPMSADYPHNRLKYMLQNSGASLILTNSRFLARARALGQEGQHPVLILNIDEAHRCPALGSQGQPGINPDKLAYILYTSGSTGRPKGVMQTHGHVLYYTRNWVERFSITAADHLTLFSSFCHDGSVQDMFSALLTGATLYPMDMRNRSDSLSLVDFLHEEGITIWHSVPSLFGFFCQSLDEDVRFDTIRYILLGGEPVREYELDMMKKYFPQAILANVYGQTESSVNTIRQLGPTETFGKPLIGDPLDQTRIFVINEAGRPVKPLRQGEIVVASAFITPGYWGNGAESQEAFTQDAEHGRLYWTGDLGRLLLDGQIEFIGRKDAQVKIRGYRVEPGEIETLLLGRPEISQCIVVPRQRADGDSYLCAYLVPATDSQGNRPDIDPAGLRKYLAGELPDYMVPSHFVQLAAFPLTQSNKIDRQALPEPRTETGKLPVPPRDRVEKRLAAVWAGILGIDAGQIGIDDNFFDSGGHSLKATLLTSRIYKEFQVKFPIAGVFSSPTIRGMAQIVRQADPETYAAVEPVEKKEYYALSSAQKRIYIMQKVAPGSTQYNLNTAVIIEEEADLPRLRRVFPRLIERHESLRTSFLLVGQEPVQKVLERVDFELEVVETGGQYGQEAIELIVRGFVRPFDLAAAPLLRVGLVKLEERKYILFTDIHHIIADGLSMANITVEFSFIYAGLELPPLTLQYRDFAEWHNQKLCSGHIGRQEEFWLNEFSGDLPRLDIPLDYPRRPERGPSGQRLEFSIDRGAADYLRALARLTDASLFMVVLAISNVWLQKISGQEDIVIGTVTLGRHHTDLEGIVGMFVNTLALRNFPRAERTFGDFLTAVRDRTLAAFDNQDYQFEDLVDRLLLARDPGRHPIFDVMFDFHQKQDRPEETTMRLGDVEIDLSRIKPYKYERNETLFELSLIVYEEDERIRVILNYSTDLFKKETIARFSDYFKEVVAAVVADPQVKLKDIKIAHELEAIKADAYRALEKGFDF